MTLPSWVAAASSAAIRAAAAAIATPAARDMASRAAALSYDPAALAAALQAAVAQISDPGALDALAKSDLGLAAVAPSTLSRRLEKRRQEALVRAVRSFAAVRRAELAAETSWTSRDDAVAARTAAIAAIESQRHGAGDDTFAALRALRAAVDAHVTAALLRLPSIVRATPGAVLPALVLAFEYYGDLARDAEIAERNRVVRPGFVPAAPIEVLSS